MISKTCDKICSFFPRTITPDQAKDTGMAMVLICLLVVFFSRKPELLPAVILLLLLNMIWPAAYKPAAKIWLGLSHLLGTVVSKIILSIIFYGLVLPVGMLQRLTGKDALRLRQWKKGRDSVFRVRDHEYEPEDIVHPY